MARTIRERLQAALLAAGGMVVQHRTSKYLVIETPTHPRNPEAPGPFYWFLGKSGSLRVNMSPTVGGSTPSEKTKAFLLAK